MKLFNTFCLIFVFSVSVVFATTNTNTAPRRSMREITGGTILRPVPEGSRGVVFLDSLGTSESKAAFEAYAKRFNSLAGLYVKHADGAWNKYKNDGGDIVIAIVASSEDYILLPEKRMAIVPLKNDTTAMNTALWNATVAIFSSLAPVPNDIHAMGLVSSIAESLSIPRAQRVFYKKALEEGWAPPPQNRFQQAVWDKFHSEKKEKSK